MNCFEKHSRLCVFLTVLGVVFLAAGIIVAALFGLDESGEMPAVIACFVIGLTFGIMLLVFGLVFYATGRMQRRLAEVLFTPQEISGLTSVFFIQIDIMKKAKRLYKEGKERGDMSEYNEFRELVMMSRPMYYTNANWNF